MAVEGFFLLNYLIVVIDWEGIMLSEISQIEKDKYYRLSFICDI